MNCRFVKLSPVFVGLYLGVAAVVMGRLPAPLATWSGLLVAGNYEGYTLGALIVAYLNSRTWLRSFITSAVTIIIASATYYLLIIGMWFLNNGESEHPIQALKDFLWWSTFGLFIGVLAATAIFLATKPKQRWIRWGAVITCYITLLGVSYVFVVTPIIRFASMPHIKESGYFTGFYSGHYFYGDIFTIAYGVVMYTAALIVAIIVDQRQDKRADNSFDVSLEQASDEHELGAIPDSY
jgi:hypothetical protein